MQDLNRTENQFEPQPGAGRINVNVNNQVAQPPYIETPRRQGRDTVIPSLLTNADILIKNKESELGFALILKALTIDSTHAQAIKKLGGLQMAQRKYSLAEKSFEVLLKSDYGFDTLARLAEVYYLQGKDSQAAERYEEAISVLMSDVENTKLLFDVYKNLGNIQCRLGDFQAAEENYFRAFSLNSSSDVLLVNLGTLDFQRGELNSSLDKFRQALSLNSRNDKAWVGLAIVHDKMGDLALAVANVENAVEISPDNRTAVHILSNWAVRDRRYSVAIEALQEYLSLVEQDEEMSLVLIHLFCLTQEYFLAKIEIERVLLWNPMNEEVIKLSMELAG